MTPEEKKLRRRDNTRRYRDRHPERKPSSAVRRAWQLKNLYGITLEQYEEMMEKQDCKCLLCSRHRDDTFYKKLDVDHCHETNKIRGLLCSRCNTLIGLAMESPAVLRRAAEYLEQHS